VLGNFDVFLYIFMCELVWFELFVLWLVGVLWGMELVVMFSMYVLLFVVFGCSVDVWEIMYV